ncbi:DUF4178 domain-containing protein [Neogemmobacter tilapiae]|uniref:DUF4178 domain-containing protein n=1 Tax=Neogemmobacter tilapiae TaxID=875041 RepID=A0A918TXE9_9RHOB|nr:DUF4178 domain-containing protein [Gemmobacter tilapiae]GHC65318.1 hypothetical protein GCM10007315_32370 [Gemmobacter tilapiae]
MTGATDRLQKIQCPSCGAGLDVLGGGRVKVQICGYCGTELDAVAGYKALRQFNDLKRPDTPFRLGMEGEIAGVRQQIIGIMGQVEVWEGQTWRWVDHLLYSETHGYSWLTLEDGHLVWSRRVRWALPMVAYDLHGIEHGEHRPGFRALGRDWTYFESGVQKTDFVEGAFTWEPKMGDGVQVIRWLTPGEMLSVELSGTEQETTLSVLLDRLAVLKSFGLDPAEVRGGWGQHVLTPITVGKEMGYTATVAGGFLAATLALMLLLAARGEEVLAAQTFPITALPKVIEMPLTGQGELVSVEFASDMANAWTELEVDVDGPDGEPLFETSRLIEYYSGYEGGESWSEGDRRDVLVFRAEGPGIYRMNLAMGETGVEAYGAVQEATKISVQAQEGVAAFRWLWVATAIFLIVMSVGPIRHWMAWHGRLKQGDWTDDED